MTETHHTLAGEHALALMQTVARWQNTTTIILHGGCVFEFKGIFPGGELAEGFYNLHSSGNGFEGHINLKAIARICFQSRAHRGRESHAFVFEDAEGGVIFKIFLGRTSNGTLIPEQVTAYHAIQAHGLLEPVHEK